MIRRCLLLLCLAGCASGRPTAAANATIRVTARQYAWTFEYPGGATSEELRLTAGDEVTLVVTSRDVVHGFSIPAFKVKVDAVPGRQASVTFRSGAPGTYDAPCAEYCGPGHHTCGTKVVVVARDP